MKIACKNRSHYNMADLSSHLESFLPYAQKKMGFNRPPTIFFDSDPQNGEKTLGKTGYYDPDALEIVIFVDNRHPKDILRSLSHELVHHTQNCRGDLEPEIAGETGLGYAQENPHMREMEREAYETGNLCFRDWEDSVKLQLKETNYLYIKGDNHKMANHDKLQEQIKTIVRRTLKETLSAQVASNAKEVRSLEETIGLERAHELDQKLEALGVPSNLARKIVDALLNASVGYAKAADRSGVLDRDLINMVVRDGDVSDDELRMIAAQVVGDRSAGSGASLEETDCGCPDQELEERTKRDSPDRARPEGGRRVKPLEEVEEETENVNEADSEASEDLDEWYQNELFGKLLKEWAK